VATGTSLAATSEGHSARMLADTEGMSAPVTAASAQSTPVGAPPCVAATSPHSAAA
jgi:hypothetical protein